MSIDHRPGNRCFHAEGKKTGSIFFAGYLREKFQARLKRSLGPQKREDATSVTSVEIQVELSSFNTFRLQLKYFRSGLAQKTRIFTSPQGKVEKVK